MVKNNTLYKGKPFLKLERYPYYIGGSKLNKIHLNLGFVKLVSRVSTKLYDEELLKKIAIQQGVELKSYKIDPHNGDIEYIDFDPNLTPCFLMKDGTWLDTESVFMYYKNNMIVESHGVARMHDNDGNTIGYYGHTHRGGQAFEIDDKLFDQDWTISIDHPDYKKYLMLYLNSKYADSIMDFVPFNERGSETIKTLEEAKQAAENICEYLS